MSKDKTLAQLGYDMGIEDAKTKYLGLIKELVEALELSRSRIKFEENHFGSECSWCDVNFRIEKVLAKASKVLEGK